jgi:hypothetical protein
MDFGSGVNYGAQRDFYKHVAQIGSMLDPGATDVQISLGVWDACIVWCNIYGSGVCHSHAPLFDDVLLVRVNTVGPQFTVRHHELFQDNFAEDGSLTGTARADAAMDILPSTSPSILPGDSVCVTVADPTSALAIDPHTGIGPAVYAYVAVWPTDQAGKSGAELEAPESRSIGKRFPMVDGQVNDGVTWYCFRMDSALTSIGVALTDRYCIDLNDSVFTPGDTICYFFKATNSVNQSNYFSRRLDGQGENFITDDIAETFASPMEFTILPAGGWLRGGDILYVDDADDQGGDVPIQLFFDSAFDNMGIRDVVDRYDVLASSSIVGNSLASRVQNITNQIIDCYQKIMWSSGSLESGLIGDGTGDPEKSDDFALLHEFLGQHPDNPGLFITGDSNAEEWVSLSGPSAITLKSFFMTFNLLNGDHIAQGETYGGCPAVNDFDVLQPTGTAQADFVSTSSGNAFVISQATQNPVLTTARVVLSGFSIHEANDTAPVFPYARAEIMKDVFTWFQNVLPTPTAVDPVLLLVSYLDNNYPNPFNPTTTIRYGIKHKGQVSLSIYNAAGQLVKTLVNDIQTPRPEGFQVRWHGESNSGGPAASGVYFYKLITKDFVQTKKMVLLK